MPNTASTSVGTKLRGSCTHLRFGSESRAIQDASMPARLSSRASFLGSRISVGAMASCTRSRLSASGVPDASRIRPRGAGIDEAATCCRVALACHCAPCQTCTCAARAMMATAKTPRTRCMSAMRLFRSITRWSWDVSSRNHDDLTIARHSQAEPLLRRGGDLVSTGGVANLTLQLGPLRPQILPLPLELLHHSRLRLTERAPPDDARSYKDETKKCERDH